MSTWKKVALEEDIAVFAGGSNADELGGTENDVLLVGANGDFDYVGLGNGQVLVGETGGPTAYSFANTADIEVDINTSGNLISFNIPASAIDSTEIAADAVQLIHIDNDTFASGSMAGRMLYWDATEEPQVLDIGNSGEVLTVSGGIPSWESAGTNTLITINDGSGIGDGNFGIIYGSESNVGTGVADTVYVDGTSAAEYSFSYNPSVTGVTHADEGSEAQGTNDSGAVYAKFGFAGDLAGTATSAKYVETTNAGSAAATYYPALLGSATTQTNSERVDVHGGLVYEITGAATGDLTVNGNLTVVGAATKVEIQSEEVQIADGRILLAHTASAVAYSDQLQAANGNKGIGIVIDNGSNTDEDDLAKLVYRGHKASSNYQNSESVLGWQIAQENNNQATTNVSHEGIATMRVGTTPGGSGTATYTMTTAGGASAINIGIGAMYWGGTGAGGGLWIQTGV